MRTKQYYSSTSLSVMMLGVLWCGGVYAAPEGGVVSGGAASISVPAAGHVVIHQHTDKAIINWQDFDTKAGEHTEFRQPSKDSAVLNRIRNGKPTSIDGKVSANGNVVIVNPQGVVFGKGASVDVGGLIASTADIADENFMKGNLGFDRPGEGNAAVVNHGTITAKDAGLVGLVAPNVANHGVITAKLGRAQLGSGDTMTVDLHGDNLIKLAVSDKVASQVVLNTGKIDAEGGTIALTAAAGREMVNSLIHVEGELHAPSISNHNGTIIIAAEGSNAVAGNTASDKGVKAGASYVSTANAFMDVSGRKAGVQGGEISVTGDAIAIGAGTVMDASGTAKSAPLAGQKDTSSLTADKQVKSEAAFLASKTRGGGSIKIGGDYLGKGDTAAAKAVYVAADTLIANEGIGAGDGGRSIVWSDGDTGFYGSVFGRGGVNGGHGGFLETSGKQMLDAQGFADLTAREGYNRGTYLLDPTNITIYGNVDPTFVSTDSTINLAADLQLWLDASDASKVQLTFSTNGVVTTANGTAGTNTITTAADVASNLAVGARIRLGAAGAVTTANTLGADTYTITAISGTTITVAETLTQTYAGSTLHRGLISQMQDKSGKGVDFSQSDVTRMPLWSRSADFNNEYTMNFIRTTGEEDALEFLNTNGNYAAFNNEIMNSTDYWIQTTAMTRSGGVNTNEEINQGIFVRDGYHEGLGFYGSPTTTNAISMAWDNVIPTNFHVFTGASSNTPYVISGGMRTNGVNDYVNGIRLSNGNNDTRNMTSKRVSGGNYYIGASLPNTSFYKEFLDGAISSTLAYGTHISGNIRNVLEQYQSAKWGIELAGVGTGATENARATSATGYSVFTTRYLERLSNTADVSLLADNNITLDLKGDTLNLANNRSLTLTTTNQNISSASAGTIRTNGTGNITFNSGGDISLSHDVDLTAQGAGDILLKAKNHVYNTGGGDYTLNGGDLILHADSDASTVGAIIARDSTINTNGGDVVFGGGANPLNNFAYGSVFSARRGINMNNTQINSGGGKVSLRGHGQANDITGSNLRGVNIDGGSSITSSGTGDVSIYGQAAASTGNFNRGIVMDNATINTTGDAKILLDAKGAGGATFTEGFILVNGSGLSSANGNIDVLSQAGNANTNNDRGTVMVSSTIQSSGNGNINITSRAGNSGSLNPGLLSQGDVNINTTNGNITLNLDKGFTGLDALQVTGANNKIGSTTMVGNININADELDLGTDANLNINTQGNVTLKPRNTARTINLGTTTGGLHLTQAELNTIKSAANVTIGDAANTSAVNVTSAIDVSALNANVGLRGDAVSLANSVTSHATKTLSVTADNGSITRTGGTLTANNINLDATSTIVAHVAATSLNIGNNSTAATITGTVAGGQTQTEANAITGGPGDNSNYTFEGFTIRKVVASSGGGGGGTPATTPTPTPVAPPEPPVITVPEVEVTPNEPPVIEIVQPTLPAPQVTPVATTPSILPSTVQIVSQQPASVRKTEPVNITAQASNNTNQSNGNNKVNQIIYVETENSTIKPTKGKISIKAELAKILGLTNRNIF
jgi:filamentous hemagglutinin family protein